MRYQFFLQISRAEWVKLWRKTNRQEAYCWICSWLTSINPFHAGYTFRCTSRQKVWLQIRPHIVGPDLRAKLFAATSIFLKMNDKIYAKYWIIPSADDISKWLPIFPSIQWVNVMVCYKQKMRHTNCYSFQRHAT